MYSKKGTRKPGRNVINESCLSDKQFKVWSKKGPGSITQ